MKNIFKINLSIFLFVASCSSFYSQTKEQVKQFANRSMMTVYQVEKEILKQNITTIDVDLKKAIKYQAIAVKLYKQNKFVEAVGYSYKARIQALALLEPINKPAVDYLDFNSEEKSLTNASNYTNLSLSNLLTAAENKKIDELNTAKFEEFRQIELNVPLE